MEARRRSCFLLPEEDTFGVLPFVELELVLVLVLVLVLLLEEAVIEADFAFVGAGFGLALALGDGFLEKKLKSVPCFFAEPGEDILNERNDRSDGGLQYRRRFNLRRAAALID
jgi:hypothetical protein